MEIDFQTKMAETVKRLDDVGREYAEAKSLAEYIDNLKKTMLASITIAQEGKSLSERETKALATEEYKTHLEGLKEARAEELRLKALLEMLHAKHTSLITLCALERGKMQMV